jgi:hypothetical protein
MSPHGRWRSLPPKGAGRFGPAGGRALPPLNFWRSLERRRREAVPRGQASGLTLIRVLFS